MSRFTEFVRAAFTPALPEYDNVGSLGPPTECINDTDQTEKVLSPEDAIWIEGYGHGATIGYDNALADVEYLVEMLEKEVKPTKVEIEFNRPLTYAEREAFRDALEAAGSDTTHRFIGDKSSAKRVVMESSLDSRDLVDDVSEFVSGEFLNVYPRAAKTIRPKTTV